VGGCEGPRVISLQMGLGLHDQLTEKGEIEFCIRFMHDIGSALSTNQGYVVQPWVYQNYPGLYHHDTV